MRKPFQRLRLALGVSATLPGLLMAFAVAAQETSIAPVVPAEATRPPVLITHPAWEVRPTPEYPERALSRGISPGRATIMCFVEADGSLSRCSVVEESPAGAGFGRSALAAAVEGRLSPRSIDPAVVGGRVSFTFNYRLPDAEPAPVPPTPGR